MKKKKLVKLSKVTRKPRVAGISSNYNIKLLALFGKKINKNKNIFINRASYIIPCPELEFKLLASKQERRFGDLRKLFIKSVSKQLVNNTYKGVRIKLKLPLRGQRTHTNAQTSRKLNSSKDTNV